MQRLDFVCMLCLSFGAVNTSAYMFTLVINETGRFTYEEGGNQMYCTICPMSEDMSSTCVTNNQHAPMPGGGEKPQCKETARGGVIPGCGPLPVSDGLSWVAQSGRPVGTNSTVYEVYLPQCGPNNQLNSDVTSVRCGENLRWDVDPVDFRCSISDTPLCPLICIIGIGVGAGLLIIIVVVVIIVCVVRRKRAKGRNPPDIKQSEDLDEIKYTPDKNSDGLMTPEDQ